MSIFGIPGSGKSFSMKVEMAMKQKHKFKSLAERRRFDIDLQKELRDTLLQGEWITEKKEKKHMFFKKLWRSIEGLETSIEKLDEQIHGTVHNTDKGLIQRLWDMEGRCEPETIDCHTCGCVVRKEIAFRGHDRIEREEIFEPSTPISGLHDFMEVTFETWYCKLHKKGKKEYGSK